MYNGLHKRHGYAIILKINYQFLYHEGIFLPV